MKKKREREGEGSRDFRLGWGLDWRSQVWENLVPCSQIPEVVWVLMCLSAK